MKPYMVNLIYAILLIGLSLWGYLVSESPSATAFIPTAFGVALLALTPGMKKENKTISHIVVVLTILVLAGLIKPLTGVLGRSDNMATGRVLVMMLWGIIALGVYINSFIAARKKQD